MLSYTNAMKVHNPTELFTLMISSALNLKFNHLNLLGHIHKALSLNVTSKLSGILHIDYVQVIQSRARDNPSVDFNTTWQAYKDGFGDINGNYWLGNLSTYIVR